MKGLAVDRTRTSWAFLDPIVNKVLEVQPGYIKTYLGNVSYYLDRKKEEAESEAASGIGSAKRRMKVHNFPAKNSGVLRLNGEMRETAGQSRFVIRYSRSKKRSRRSKIA
ncbi:MAG: hypothetical protein U5K71_11080 [Gracilimonas sp.]|nr:hypothetical protein [Gracilimonas sp.]